MKRRFKNFAMAAVALLAMSACSNETDETTSATQGKPVSFQMGLVSTRTSTTTDYVTTFVQGDAVGIFAYERNADGTDGTLVVTNAKYVLNAAGTTWDPAEASNAAYADTKKAFNYYAYYPYLEGVTNPGAVAMTVKLNQSTPNAADYNTSDALTARNKTVPANSTNVALQFTHAFALVQVNLEGTMADKDATVTMQNVFPGATLNLQHADDALAGGDANGAQGNIQMYSMSEINEVTDADRFSFRAIVPAQSVVANAALLEIQSKGKTYRFTYSTAVDYVAGKGRLMKVTLGETPAKSTITIPAANMTVYKWGTTDAGTGTGSAEEAAVTSVIPEIKAGIDFAAKGIWTTDKVTGTNTYWFHRENTVGVTTVAIDETDGPALALTLGATGKGSWNNSCIGYHFYGKLERATYKVSLTMKSDITGGIVGITVSGSQDDKMFKMLNDKPEDWSRNVTTFGSLNSTWITKVFYIDTMNASVNGKASDLTAYTATTDADVEAGINIMLYNYTAGASTVYIKDIKVEKYTAAAP